MNEYASNEASDMEERRTLGGRLGRSNDSVELGEMKNREEHVEKREMVNY
jgi:hypothetical protein